MGNHHSHVETRERHGKNKQVMDRLRRSLRESFRRKKDHVPECSKPHQWQADESAVRAGTCNFPVKYLGCVEVFESRGMQVCEEALKVLRNSRRRAVRGTLYVTGDGLRVVDDDTKGLLVDQTIEKVSFCAPDRNHEKGFSYICRDGTTRRWMCHGFLAIRDSGERLSHAVGCAFGVCLERKQKRDKESVMVNFDPQTSAFTRTGSFRSSSLTERMQDPQECKPTGNKSTEAPPVKQVHNPYAIERPHATPTMLQRQGSFRGFSSLNQASPFKRQLSLRINDLPSTVERQRSMSLGSSDFFTQRNGPSVAPIPESSPSTERQDTIISAMCQQLSQGLSFLSSNDDPFISASTNLPSQQETGSSRAEAWLASSAAIVQQEHQPSSVPSSPTLSRSNFNPNEAHVNQVPESVLMAQPQPIAPPRHSSPNFSHLRSSSLGSAEAFMSQFVPSSETESLNENQVANTQMKWTNGIALPAAPMSAPPYRDPFDAEWVELAKRHQSSTNPFAQNSVKAFEVHM